MAFQFELRNNWETVHDDVIQCICIRPDGCYLASGGSDCKLIIWETSSNNPVHFMLASSAITSLVWCAQPSDILLCGTEDGTLFTLRFDEDKIEAIGYNKFSKAIKYLEVNHDLPVAKIDGSIERFLAIDNCPEVSVWQWESSDTSHTWSEKQVIPRLPDADFDQVEHRPLVGFKWLHDEERHCIAIGWTHYGISIFNMHDQQWSRTILLRNCGPFDISAGNKLFAICEVTTGFRIFSTSSGLPVLALHDERMAVPDTGVPVVFSAGGQLLCLGSSRGEVHCWNSEDYQRGKPHQYMQVCPLKDAAIIKALCIYYRRGCDGHVDLRIYISSSQAAARKEIFEFRPTGGDHHSVP